MTTGVGLKSAVAREAPTIRALLDDDASDESIVSVMPQPIKSTATSPGNKGLDFRGFVVISFSYPAEANQS